MSDPHRSQSWKEAMVAERLIADREFQDRVFNSSLSNQSWELVMTAVEFDIRSPKDPDAAELVARTDRLDDVLPAIADVESRQQGGGYPDDSSSGLFGRIMGSLGLGGGDDSGYRQEAERLATEYATELQRTLEDRGRWDDVVERAAEETS